MKSYGAYTERHDNSKKSAVRLVGLLLSTPPTLLTVVKELVEKHLSWKDTTVGRADNEALNELSAQNDKKLGEKDHVIAQLEASIARIAKAEEKKDDKIALLNQHQDSTIAQLKERNNDMTMKQEKRTWGDGRRKEFLHKQLREAQAKIDENEAQHAKLEKDNDSLQQQLREEQAERAELAAQQARNQEQQEKGKQKFQTDDTPPMGFMPIGARTSLELAFAGAAAFSLYAMRVRNGLEISSCLSEVVRSWESYFVN